MHISLKTILLLSFISNFAQATSSQKIILAIGASYSEPYIFLDSEGKLKDGIIKRFGDAIAAEMNLPIEYQVLPVKRVHDSLFDNTTNMICFETESWIPELLNKVNWTPAVFQEREVIVTNANDSLKSLNDLKGTMGTILGYQYPKMQSIFDKGQLKRADNTTLSANFMKLKTGRINMILDENTPISYFIKNQHLENSVKLWDGLTEEGKILSDVVNRYDLKCIYNNSLNKDQVDKAFNNFKTKGIMNEILAAYGRKN